jgi:hypothetical protein
MLVLHFIFSKVLQIPWLFDIVIIKISNTIGIFPILTKKAGSVHYSTTMHSPFLLSPCVFLTLGSPFCLKNLTNKKQILSNFLWKLSIMKENGLTKKMNPNTNIFNSVVNVVQTFKVWFTWRHNVAPNSTCKTIKPCTLFCRKRVKFDIYFTFNNLYFAWNIIEWNKLKKQSFIFFFKIR